jgi:hypothetical protein
MSHPLLAYLAALRENRRVGTRETSSYPALAALFDEAGKGLKPRVRCVIHPQNRGAGIPDGGFFTADQLQEDPTGDVQQQTPARGVMEVKSTREEVSSIILSDQGKKYLARYGLLLVTNYRDFVLFGCKGGTGADKDAPVARERYTLAPHEAAFWQTPLDALAQAHGTQFAEFLRRVLLHNAPLTRPEDLAAFLASYARDALVRVERAAGLPALEQLQAALEEALGIHFTDAKGRHFFHSTLVQTLFYGIFSAWVLWSKEHAPDDPTVFDWRNAVWSLHVPMIAALFGQLALPEKLKPLGLVEVLDWAGAALNRVDRAQFFEAFETGHAVQYFYEPFLEAFDPQLRKDLGVWYTPPEIVEYMVARVDAVLQSELGLSAGLADERVVVLDPCCGTGAYLVATLRHIAHRLADEGMGAVAGQYVKQAAMKRVFGFELLPAPFVVSHLQLGVLLQSLGAPLDDATHERAGVFLTNALTGWEPREGDKLHLPLPELQEERDAAAHIKRDEKILVVIGNPPYNGFAGMAIDEERALSNAYRTTKRAPAPQGQGLNDLYVRFFRMAERRIVEETGQGIVCYISNYSWLDGLSYTGMRERYLEVFDRIWIDCMNGDKYKTGKLTPDGKPDPSVFSTEFNPEGIQVGTAIALLARRAQHAGDAVVEFRHIWGKTKRAQLLDGSAPPYQTERPALEIGLPFMPTQVNDAYLTWPKLPDLFPVSFPGVKTSRDDVVVDIDRDRLETRMRQYFDPAISHDEMRRIAPGAMENSANFQAAKTREQLQKRGFSPDRIIRYCYRPFDIRWLYWESEGNLLDRSRAEYFPHVFQGNHCLITQQKPRREWSEPQVIQSIGCLDLMDRGASCIPLYLKPNARGPELFAAPARDAPLPNLSERALAYLTAVDALPPDLFAHAVAILHAPQYRAENGGALRQDWPRIPLPATGELLRASAALGRQVAALLDVEQAVSELAGEPFRSLGMIDRVGGGQLGAAEFAVRAGWGHRGESGVTMPGKGRVITRERTPAELAALEAGAAALGLTPEAARACLGEQTCDVYLNDTAYWANVPARVWNYTIGGYQVIKKWLSYREQAVLGRALTLDEAARVVPAMVRRIAALLLLGPALDANYRSVTAATMPWG